LDRHNTTRKGEKKAREVLESPDPGRKKRKEEERKAVLLRN